MKLLVTAEDI